MSAPDTKARPSASKTKPVNTMSGVNSAPRRNFQVGSSSDRSSHEIVVRMSRISRGLIGIESWTKKIDSRLDMFLVNGHQSVVTASPISVRNTIT